MRLVFRERPSDYVVVTDEGRAIVMLPLIGAVPSNLTDNTCEADAVLEEQYQMLPGRDGEIRRRIRGALVDYIQDLDADIGSIDTFLADNANLIHSGVLPEESVQELRDIRAAKSQRKNDINFYLTDKPVQGHGWLNGLLQDENPIHEIINTLSNNPRNVWNIIGSAYRYRNGWLQNLTERLGIDSVFNVYYARLSPRNPDRIYRTNPGAKSIFSEAFGAGLREAFEVRAPDLYNYHYTPLANTIIQKERRFSPLGAFTDPIDLNALKGDIETSVGNLQESIAEPIEEIDTMPASELLPLMRQYNNNFMGLLRQVYEVIISKFGVAEGELQENLSFDRFLHLCNLKLENEGKSYVTTAMPKEELVEQLKQYGFQRFESLFHTAANALPETQDADELTLRQEFTAAEDLPARPSPISFLKFMSCNFITCSISQDELTKGELIEFLDKHKVIEEFLSHEHPLFDYKAVRDTATLAGGYSYFEYEDKTTEFLSMKMQLFITLISANVEWEDGHRDQSILSLLHSNHDFFRSLFAALTDHGAIERLGEGGYFNYAYNQILEQAEAYGIGSERFKAIPYSDFYKYFVGIFKGTALLPHYDETVFAPCRPKQGMFCYRAGRLMYPLSVFVRDLGARGYQQEVFDTAEEHLSAFIQYMGPNDELDARDSLLPVTRSTHSSQREHYSPTYNLQRLLEASLGNVEQMDEAIQYLLTKEKSENGLEYNFVRHNEFAMLAQNPMWIANYKPFFLAKIAEDQDQDASLKYATIGGELDDDSEFNYVITSDFYHSLRSYALAQGLIESHYADNFTNNSLSNLLCQVFESDNVELHTSQQQENGPITVHLRGAQIKALAETIVDSNNKVFRVSPENLNNLYKYFVYWYTSNGLTEPELFTAQINQNLERMLRVTGLVPSDTENEVHTGFDGSSRAYVLYLKNPEIINTLRRIFAVDCVYSVWPNQLGLTQSQHELLLPGDEVQMRSTLSSQRNPQATRDVVEAYQQARGLNPSAGFEVPVNYNARTGFSMPCAGMLYDRLPNLQDRGPRLNLVDMGQTDLEYTNNLDAILSAGVLNNGVFVFSDRADLDIENGSPEGRAIVRNSPGASELRKLALTRSYISQGLIKNVLDHQTYADLVQGGYFNNGVIDAWRLCQNDPLLAERVSTMFSSNRHRLEILLQQIDTSSDTGFTAASLPMLTFDSKPEGAEYSDLMVKLASRVWGTSLATAAKVATFKGQILERRPNQETIVPMVISLNSFNGPQAAIIAALDSMNRALRGYAEVQVFALKSDSHNLMLEAYHGRQNEPGKFRHRPNNLSASDFCGMPCIFPLEDGRRDVESKFQEFSAGAANDEDLVRGVVDTNAQLSFLTAFRYGGDLPVDDLDDSFHTAAENEAYLKIVGDQLQIFNPVASDLTQNLSRYVNSKRSGVDMAGSGVTVNTESGVINVPLKNLTIGGAHHPYIELAADYRGVMKYLHSIINTGLDDASVIKRYKLPPKGQLNPSQMLLEPDLFRVPAAEEPDDLDDLLELCHVDRRPADACREYRYEVEVSTQDHKATLSAKA